MKVCSLWKLIEGIIVQYDLFSQGLDPRKDKAMSGGSGGAIHVELRERGLLNLKAMLHKPTHDIRRGIHKRRLIGVVYVGQRAKE